MAKELRVHKMEPDSPGFPLPETKTPVSGQMIRRPFLYLCSRRDLDSYSCRIGISPEVDPRTIELESLLKFARDDRGQYPYRNFLITEMTQDVIVVNNNEYKSEPVESSRYLYNRTILLSGFVLTERELAKRVTASLRPDNAYLQDMVYDASGAKKAWLGYSHFNERAEDYSDKVYVAVDGSLDGLNDIEKFVGAGVVPQVLSMDGKRNPFDVIVLDINTGKILHSTTPMMPLQPEPMLKTIGALLTHGQK